MFFYYGLLAGPRSLNRLPIIPFAFACIYAAVGAALMTIAVTVSLVVAAPVLLLDLLISPVIGAKRGWSIGVLVGLIPLTWNNFWDMSIPTLGGESLLDFEYGLIDIFYTMFFNKNIYYYKISRDVDSLPVTDDMLQDSGIMADNLGTRDKEKLKEIVDMLGIDKNKGKLKELSDFIESTNKLNNDKSCFSLDLGDNKSLQFLNYTPIEKMWEINDWIKLYVKLCETKHLANADNMLVVIKQVQLNENRGYRATYDSNNVKPCHADALRDSLRINGHCFQNDWYFQHVLNPQPIEISSGRRQTRYRIYSYESIQTNYGEIMVTPDLLEIAMQLKKLIKYTEKCANINMLKVYLGNIELLEPGKMISAAGYIPNYKDAYRRYPRMVSGFFEAKNTRYYTQVSPHESEDESDDNVLTI